MVALLLIPIENPNISHKRPGEQWKTNREVLNDLLWRLCQPVNIKQYHSAESGNVG